MYFIIVSSNSESIKTTIQMTTMKSVNLLEFATWEPQDSFYLVFLTRFWNSLWTAYHFQVHSANSGKIYESIRKYSKAQITLNHTTNQISFKY